MKLWGRGITLGFLRFISSGDQLREADGEPDIDALPRAQLPHAAAQRARLVQPHLQAHQAHAQRHHATEGKLLSFLTQPIIEGRRDPINVSPCEACRVSATDQV